MKQKTYNGALGRFHKQSKDFKQIACMILFIAGYLIFTSLTGGDSLIGAGISAATVFGFVAPAGVTDPIELKKLEEKYIEENGGPAGVEVKRLFNEFTVKNKAMEDLIKKNSADDAEKIKALQDEIKELTTKSIQALRDENLSLAKAMSDLKTEFAKNGKSEKAMTLKEEIAEHKENIKSIAQKGFTKDGASEMVLKTLVQRSAVDGNTQSTNLPDIGQIGHRRLSLWDMFPKINVSESNNNGTIKYWDWDEDTYARAAAAVAEGGTFPASTAKWKEYTVSIKKVGDSIPVTEEFFEDEQMFADELNLFLDTNVALEIDRQMCESTGTGNEIYGLKYYAPDYTAAAAGIADASIYDLIVKVKESIVKTRGSKYIVDFAVMNLTTINKMKLKKDANDNYVIPPFADRNGNIIDGVTVIESNVFADNEMVMGDSRFAKTYVKKGIEITKGQINDQFVTDQVTLKARARFCFLIRNVDKTGFAHVTDIDAALAILATPA